VLLAFAETLIASLMFVIIQHLLQLAQFRLHGG